MNPLAPEAFPPVTCGKCYGKPVDKIRSYYDQCAAHMVYVFMCHGASEQVEVDDELMCGVESVSMVAYVAFSSAPLLQPKRPQLPEPSLHHPTALPVSEPSHPVASQAALPVTHTR